MQPSTYQQAILNWLKSGSGHGCCNAVAGSGKSTTLKLGALALKESGLSPSEIKIIVFGKANSLDLIAKFGSEWKESISTLHSAGFFLVKQELAIRNSRDVKVTGTKYRKIAQDFGFISSRGNPKPYGGLTQQDALSKEDDFVHLLDLVRLTNQEPTAEAVRDICLHFEMPDVYEFDIVASAIAECLQEGEAQARRKECFDFTDQIWLPVQWKLNERRWFKPYRFVLVDECQDLNATQLELSRSLPGSEGRLLYVGDPRQAIMGFAGADNRSYSKIVERTKATELPLSICYRCPSEHIKLVKRQFPEIPIEPRENAPEGAIVQCAENDLNTLLKVGDMVISRKTAPLVTLCIRLIARGIKATVKGREIGNTIKKDLNEIAKIPGFTYDRFNEAVEAYRAAKFTRYEGMDNADQLKENLKDKLEALQTIYRNQPNAKSIAALESYIDELFSDDSSPITLSTCHRAKGLEGERIFIHKAEDMPMKWRNQQPWQLEQEENLLYVALTRSKSELFVVGNPGWLTLDEPETETAESETPQDSQSQGAVEPMQPVVRAVPTIEAPAAPTRSVEWVNLGLILLDAGTQIPTRHDEATIANYAEQMADDRWEWEREPLPVLFNDDLNGTFYPGDGHHRILAAGRAERESILAEIREGSLRDAIFYSLSANRYHGLPRTNADKRSAVEIALKDAEWQQMSDRAIAAHTGTSAPFVGKVRAELAEQGTVNAYSERVDKKGRKIKTENIGTKPKTEPVEEPTAQPTAELKTASNRRQDGSIDRRSKAARATTPNLPSDDLPMPNEALSSLVKQHGAKSVAMMALEDCSLDELTEIQETIDDLLERMR